MPARKSRKSRSVVEERQQYARRPHGSRRPLPVVGVVCDDARTAKAYFDLLKRIVKRAVTLHVYRNPHDRATAAEIVAKAKKVKTALTDSNTEDDRTDVWALIDLEQEEARRTAAREAKKNTAIRVALSDPCFEVWTLAHLLDTGEAFTDCRAVLAKLEIEWTKKFNQPLGPKAQADYQKIIEFRGVAATRARRHHAKPSPDPSWTEVYQLIEQLEQFTESE